MSLPGLADALDSASAVARRSTESLASLPILDVVLPLTLLLVLFPGGGPVYYATVALAATGLAISAVRVLPWFWFAVAGMRTLDHLNYGWYLVDNHHYLLTYWCGALGLVLLSRNATSVLRVNARLLLGLCFAFATLWKLLGGQYMDGSFPGYLILTDSGVSNMIPGINVSADLLESNTERIAELGATLGSPNTARLEGLTTSLHAAAIAMGVWTIGLELLIAVGFLLPLSRRWRHLGDFGLLAFVATTYAVAPVLVFGLLLVLMGLAQTRKRDVWWRLGYLLAFLLLPLFVYTVVGDPVRGIRFFAAVFLLAYIYGWGRWALIIGLVSLGPSAGVLGGTLAEMVLWSSVGIGAAVLFLSLLDLLFRRRTERPLQWIGISCLGIGAFLTPLGVTHAASVALAGILSLVLAGKAQTLRG